MQPGRTTRAEFDMVRREIRWHPTTMRKLVVLALLAGCYTESTPVVAPVAAPVATTNPYARTLGDPLGFLPRDAEIVVHLDATALRRTQLWARIEPALLEKAAGQLEPLRRICGFDPIQQIERMTLGVRVAASSEGVLVIAGLDRTQLMGCMVRVAKSSPQTLRIERNVVLAARSPDEKPLAFTFVDANLLVVVIGPEAMTADSVRALLGAGAPLRGNERVMEMFGRIIEPHHAWGIVDGSGKALASLGALGGVPAALLGTIDAPAGATAQAVIHMKVDTEAASLATLLRGQAQAIGTMVDKVEIKQDGVDVIVDLGLTEAQLMTVTGFLVP
jgi:hypothetical protein